MFGIFIAVCGGGVYTLILWMPDIIDWFYFMRRSKKEELDKLNTLYQCTKCKRFTRWYSASLAYLKETGQEITNLSQAPSTCPHCKGVYGIKFDSLEPVPRYTRAQNILEIYEGKEYKWMETHPDCAKLTKQGYKEYKKGIKKAKEHLETIEDIESFQKYQQLVEEQKKEQKRLNKVLKKAGLE